MRKNSRTASLPVSAEILNQLLERLEERLGEDECDHTHRYTEEFLEESSADGEEALAWLMERGGVCDCEVLASLEDELRG
jgi:hypothetical protein